MTRFLAATVSALAIIAAAAPANATLQIEVFDNGVLFADFTGFTTGVAAVEIANDPNFANITINAQGSPILPKADLSSVTLDATTSSSFSGTHTLTVDTLQSSITGTGNTLSTFTVNTVDQLTPARRPRAHSPMERCSPRTHSTSRCSTALLGRCRRRPRRVHLG